MRSVICNSLKWKSEAASAARRALYGEANPHWHLLRLYSSREISGALVTAPGQRENQLTVPRRASTRFLDRAGNIEVADYGAFVGRRRDLQGLLKILRPANPTDGETPVALVAITGMGGLGKSTLTARVLQRLEPYRYRPAVWRGKVAPASLRASADLVIDTSKGFSELDLLAMRSADEVLMVTQLDLPCLRNVVRLLATFDEDEALRQKVKVVVNRVGQERQNQKRHRILTRLAANSGPEPVGNDTIARFRGTIVSVLAAEADAAAQGFQALHQRAKSGTGVEMSLGGKVEALGVAPGQIRLQRRQLLGVQRVSFANLTNSALPRTRVPSAQWCRDASSFGSVAAATCSE